MTVQAFKLTEGRRKHTVSSFKTAALVRLLCVSVHVRIRHYIIVSLQVKNSPVRTGADLLGAVQSKDITVGLSVWEYDDLLTL